MTEEEAKNKICPHLMQAAMLTATVCRIFHSTDDEGVNLLMAQSACGASDCAMWVETRSQKEADAYNDMSQIGTKLQQPSGHCGLIK